jgi:hypothetical protein
MKPLQAFSFPIGVQLFNRPEYAEKILVSLSNQSVSIDQSRLFIYIDGFRGSIYASEERVDKTAEVEAVAKSIFPNAIIVRFEVNVGIADLHNRLQERAFSNGDEWAAFFEEDLVLDEFYLEALAELMNIVDGSEEVVRVACFQILPSLYHLPRGYDGFYPGRGTQAFAERRSFFIDKQEMVCKFIELIKMNLGSRDQFKDNQAAVMMATHGHFLPYFQHDSLIESLVFQTRKLHVVTRPGLARDIGSNGIHNYITPVLANPDSKIMGSQSIDARMKSFQNDLPAIRVESNEYMQSILRDLFDSFHLSKSRRAMLRRILGRQLNNSR